MNPDRSCHRTVLALPWLLNGSLDAAQRREVREHLIGCPRCRGELTQTRQTLELFGADRATATGAPAPADRRPGVAPRRLGGTLLRRLSWAAMIALLLAAVTTWTRRSPVETAARAERPLEPRAERLAAMPATTAAALPATPAPHRRPAAARLAARARISQPAPQPASPSVSRPAPERIAMGIERPSALVISSTSFETGDLGAWQ